MMLLTTKLIPPRIPTVLVVRDRLLQQLDAALTHRLILLSASAGWGKTTLLSTWAASRSYEFSVLSAELRGSNATQNPELKTQNFKVAWVSLDELDNDPTQFWVALITALHQCVPTVGQVALAMLQSSERAPLSAILTVLLNELASIPEPAPLLLILDDYHVIKDAAIHEALTFALDRLPTHVHVVLATRVDPELPLSRWRVRGELLELRAADLRFTAAEASTFFSHVLGDALAEDDVQLLEQRTEGWVAGLHLAALAMRQREDRSAFVRAFSGSHRYLLDYVQEEILSRQPLHVQRFLLQIAVLRRVNAALCAALTQDTTSQVLLEWLERHNLFVAPLDDERQWYRVHDLFREVLLARLQATEPETAPRLHRRAAEWYAGQGELREAIAHALAAHDFAYAIDLIERAAPQLWLRGEAQTVHTWLHALPDDIFWGRARLALDTALRLPESLRPTDTAAFTRVQIQVEQTLARVEAGLHMHRELDLSDSELALLRRRLRLLRALIDMRAIVVQGDIAGLRRLAEETARLAEQEEAYWKLMGLSVMFWLAFSFRQEEPRLIPRLLEVKEQAIQAGEHAATIRAIVYLAHMYGCMGRLHQFEQECLEGLARAKGLGVHTAGLGNLHLNLAEIYYAWNRLEEAAESLQSGLEVAQTWAHRDLLLWGLTQLARLELARDDLAAVDRALQQAEEIVQREQFMHWAPTVAATRVRYWLATGDRARAERWSAQTELDPHTLTPAQDAAVLAQVRVSLAGQQYLQALETLERFAAQFDPPGHIPITVEFLTLYLCALHHGGERTQARGVAARLFSLTASEDNIRVYLEAGEPMRQVLESLRDTPGNEEEPLPPRSVAFVAKLLTTFSQELGTRDLGLEVHEPSLTPSPQPLAPLVESLTRREQEVLRLLVGGASNQEIASELVISLWTVKKHVSNLLGKLGVSSRAQAIARARDWSHLD